MNFGAADIRRATCIFNAVLILHVTILTFALGIHKRWACVIPSRGVLGYGMSSPVGDAGAGTKTLQKEE